MSPKKGAVLSSESGKTHGGEKRWGVRGVQNFAVKERKVFVSTKDSGPVMVEIGHAHQAMKKVAISLAASEESRRLQRKSGQPQGRFLDTHSMIAVFNKLGSEEKGSISGPISRSGSIVTGLFCKLPLRGYIGGGMEKEVAWGKRGFTYPSLPGNGGV